MYQCVTIADSPFRKWFSILSQVRTESWIGGGLGRSTHPVVGLKENSSRRDGIVWVRTVGRDEAGEVLSYVRWVMVRKRGQAPTRFLEEPRRPPPYPAVTAAELLSVDAGPTEGRTGALSSPISTTTRRGK